MCAKGSFGLDIRVVAVGDGDLNSNITSCTHLSHLCTMYHLNVLLVLVLWNLGKTRRAPHAHLLYSIY